MNSSQLLERNARKYPSREAVVSQKERLTYEQLDRLVNQFGSAVKEAGIQRGDKVALFVPNVTEFVVAYFAMQRLGAVVVPINVKLALPEVEHILKHSEAKALIAHQMVFHTVKMTSFSGLKIKTGPEAPGWMDFNALLNSGDPDPIFCGCTEDDESTILYTSGTTGDPKGVLFSYRNILTVASMICIEMEVKPESRILLMMPLSHSAPLHLFLMAGMMVGSTLVLTPAFTPELLINTVEEERTTHFFGAPVAYLATLTHPRLKEADLSSMKWWVYGGAPLSENEVRQVKQAFQTDQLVCVYGLTEAGPSGTLLLGDEHDQKAGSIGKRGAQGTEIRLVDDNGEDVPQGEIGEIVLRGEGNMLGYYRNEAATNAVYLGEWLKTGDLAKQDEEGYFFIVDRKKDVIITGGVNVYPKEIEEALLQFGIKEAAVIGVPHPEWGETVKAIFAADGKVEESELRAFLEERLAKFKVPRMYEQVDALPRNASGKILKQPLREGSKV
ncbi:long-chain-fatty-acid--CoA ligase [Halobacillus salinarum]|uniref:Long-chain-fatty-acid--CoA ligase n=1 Tax=Halobacillus salinarum TaxID=2932257 RepID=A0ABY4ENP7_9BACI|nr:long-chain-fatty-acid--CoA ligase [Halobacillus salinarum]UOQ45567.1 long-chain-fatty-acid--CoA ligase [Halobacillus salinarum]